MAAKKRSSSSRVEAARTRMYRDLVFECAERVFAEKGFDESTMQDVAAEAGISLKTLYATFPGKREIYAEIQAVRGAAFLAAVREGARGGSALERLEHGLRAFVRFLLEHDAYRSILLREGHAWGLHPDTEELRKHWRSGTETMADILRQGIAEGVFHDGDPELLAGSAMAVMQIQLAGRLARASAAPDADEIVRVTLIVLRRMLCVEPESLQARTERAE